MFKKLKEKPGALSLVITVATIYTGLLAYSTAASYRAGYLSYFGVSIDMVPFWPKISDFMIAPVLSIVYILLATGLAFLAIVAGNFLGYWTTRLFDFIRKHKSQETLPQLLDTTTKYLVVIFFICISFSVPYFTIQGFGESYAKAIDQVTVLADSEETEVLIYQHDSVGIIKKYDPETKQFSSDYEIIDITGQKFERVTIER